MRLISLNTIMDFARFKKGQVHFKNSAVKGVKVHNSVEGCVTGNEKYILHCFICFSVVFSLCLMLQNKLKKTLQHFTSIKTWSN